MIHSEDLMRRHPLSVTFKSTSFLPSLTLSITALYEIAPVEGKRVPPFRIWHNFSYIPFLDPIISSLVGKKLCMSL